MSENDWVMSLAFAAVAWVGMVIGWLIGLYQARSIVSKQLDRLDNSG